MAQILKFRSKSRRREPAPEVSLVIERNICPDAKLRNLIDTWIVPKMIDDWIGRSDANLDPLANEDNGEHP